MGLAALRRANPAGSSPEQGTSIEEQHPVPPVERRQLTVPFCDLVGSTSLSSRLDPEELREVIASLYDCIATTVTHFGGYVSRCMGDGALVCFGYPQSFEDNAERAVGAALALVELGYSLVPLRGWGALETAQAFNRAGALSRVIGDTPSQFRALWGVGGFHFVQGNQRKAGEIAEQCLALARRIDDDDALIEAHYLLGIARCVGGEFTSGCSELEACIRLHGGDVREMHRLLYGQDAKAAALGWLAMARWVLGYPDEALAKAHEGLAFVRNATQPFLRARGMAGVGFVHVFRREPRGSDSELPAVLTLCAEQGFAYFHAVVSAFQGANLVLLDNTQEGIDLMQASLASLRSAGSELLLTQILVNLASAHLALGHIDEARTVLDEGFDAAARNGERWAESELHRLRGELLRRQGSAPEEAEACMRQAITIAREQQAKSFELRATMALASLVQQGDRKAEGKAWLAAAIGDWPMGMDTTDLRDARTLLAKFD